MGALVAPITPPRASASSLRIAKFSAEPTPRPPATITSASSRLTVSEISLTMSTTFVLIASAGQTIASLTISPALASSASAFLKAPERRSANSISLSHYIIVKNCTSIYRACVNDLVSVKSNTCYVCNTAWSNFSSSFCSKVFSVGCSANENSLRSIFLNYFNECVCVNICIVNFVVVASNNNSLVSTESDSLFSSAFYVLANNNSDNFSTVSATFAGVRISRPTF